MIYLMLTFGMVDRKRVRRVQSTVRDDWAVPVTAWTPVESVRVDEAVLREAMEPMATPGGVASVAASQLAKANRDVTRLEAEVASLRSQLQKERRLRSQLQKERTPSPLAAGSAAPRASPPPPSA